MQEKELVIRMKSDFRKVFYQGIQKWEKKNSDKKISEIPRNTVMTALWNAAKKTVHSRTRPKEIPDELLQAIFVCIITGNGPRYKLDKIYEVLTEPVNWTSLKMGILA